MCGIAGIWNPRRTSGDTLRRMLDAQTHRGPDDTGQFFDDHVALGHRRLSILDPSPLGRQPMAAMGGQVQLVFNGEIYNFRPLRDQLKAAGHPFRSNTDSEVLLRGYLQWGQALVDRLVGDFALAIYDARRPSLWLARDRFGVKPLYYAHTGEQLLFASEVRALMQSGLIVPHLNEARLPEFLALQSVAPPATLMRDVHMLPPGSTMHITPDELTTRTYWDLAEHAAEPLYESTETIRREINRRLYRAVERQMVSDVPLGAFLSGGIDSTAVVGMMSQVVDKPIQTIAVSFDEAGYDDGYFARLAADAFQTDHHEVRLKDAELQELAEAALAAQDHPSADGINTYIVSRAARSAGLTVALSGLGGDELFAGYSNFARLARLSKLRRLWRCIPETARGELAALLDQPRRSIRAQKIAALLRVDGSIAQTYPVVRRVLSDSQINALLRTNTPAYLPVVDRLEDAFWGRPSMPELSKISCAEATSYMHDILLRDTDQMSMAHSLEVRVPLLDHELAEYVVRAPDRAKQPRHAPKQLLVEALDGLLPEPIVHRPKQGFQMPFDRWLKGPLRPTCEANLSRVGALQAFDAATIEQLWADFLAGRSSVSWSRVWLLNCLGSWIKHTLEAI